MLPAVERAAMIGPWSGYSLAFVPPLLGGFDALPLLWVQRAPRGQGDT